MVGTRRLLGDCLTPAMAAASPIPCSASSRRRRPPTDAPAAQGVQRSPDRELRQGCVAVGVVPHRPQEVRPKRLVRLRLASSLVAPLSGLRRQRRPWRPPVSARPSSGSREQARRIRSKARSSSSPPRRPMQATSLQRSQRREPPVARLRPPSTASSSTRSRARVPSDVLTQSSRQPSPRSPSRGVLRRSRVAPPLAVPPSSREALAGAAQGTAEDDLAEELTANHPLTR